VAGSQKARTPDPIDEHVGRQIERRRKARAASQSSLAQAVGVSLQQIQKYELGVNRVSASRLYHIAVALGCAPGDLFPQRTA
jgi:transcriptional regulator with XRE-family HTH domain